MKRRSSTPWKKSRTYGDIFGGRLHRRLTDNIFARAHSLARPDAGQQLPILVQDNPSRDFHFPIDIQEVADTLMALSPNHGAAITHIWFRRKATTLPGDDERLAEYICGSGVRVIVLYPWRTDGFYCLGRMKPHASEMAPFRRFGGQLQKRDDSWWVQLDGDKLRRFYLEYLLGHELGHHVDRYRRNWSKANCRQVEEFADQYAVVWAARVGAVVASVK